jgi:hypothetical protein
MAAANTATPSADLASDAKQKQREIEALPSMTFMNEDRLLIISFTSVLKSRRTNGVYARQPHLSTQINRRDN